MEVVGALVVVVALVVGLVVGRIVVGFGVVVVTFGRRQHTSKSPVHRRYLFENQTE